MSLKFLLFTLFVAAYSSPTSVIAKSPLVINQIAETFFKFDLVSKESAKEISNKKKNNLRKDNEVGQCSELDDETEILECINDLVLEKCFSVAPSIIAANRCGLAHSDNPGVLDGISDIFEMTKAIKAINTKSECTSYFGKKNDASSLSCTAYLIKGKDAKYVIENEVTIFDCVDSLSESIYCDIFGCGLRRMDDSSKGRLTEESDDILALLKLMKKKFHFCNKKFKLKHDKMLQKYIKPVKPCSGYFCDKFLNSIFMIMTHNSYSVGEVDGLDNQYVDIITQFDKYGVRGFNLDVYDETGCKIIMQHKYEDPDKIDYSDQMKTLMSRLSLKKNEFEFVLIQFQNQIKNSACIDDLIEPFGDKVIKDFDIEKPLGYYLSKGQQVLLVTDRYNEDYVTAPIYNTEAFISENGYYWGTSTINSDGPSTSWRRGPTDVSATRPYASLMSYFVTPANEAASRVVNHQLRALHHIREFISFPYTGHKINVLLVDYLKKDMMELEKLIRKGKLDYGCWKDGKKCSEEDNRYKNRNSCFYCCYDTYSYWNSKNSQACGLEYAK